MSNKNKVKPIILILVLITVILLELNILLLGASTSTIQGDPKEISYWHKTIKKVGGQEAYELFKAYVKDFKPGTQHSSAHIFGEALYKASGLTSVAFCDNLFSYGCYHAFLGTAIAAEGLSVVPTLNQSCMERLESQSLGCQHGIGHGIAAYLGYKYEDLAKGLSICDNLPIKDPIGGCVGGIFMEYNFQTMLAEDARTREYNSSQPLYPCDKLTDSYHISCYFWQAQWWSSVLPGTNEEKYRSIGTLCQNLKDPKVRIQCFLGSGNTIGSLVDWEAEGAVKLCSEIKSPDGQFNCRAGAAGAFFAIPSSKDEAPKICDGYNQKQKEECIKRAHLSISENKNNI